MDEQYLVGVEYPATKAEVIAVAEDRGAPQDLLEAMQAARAESFDSAAALRDALRRS